MSDLQALGARARAAADQLAGCDAAVRNQALGAIASAISEVRGEVLAANAADVAAASAGGVRGALLDRLTLTPVRLDAMLRQLGDIAGLDDPLGEVIEEWHRPNGLTMRRVRVPLGVVAVIYEARPNVTTDVAGLCVKSANAAVLRGSSTAQRSNLALVAAIRTGLSAAGLPADAVQLVEDTSRETAVELMRLRGSIDLLVPRGGPALIAQLIESATVPYVIDGDGNCHVYVDADADLDKAASIVLDAKLSKPSVCNSAEKLLVHADVAARLLPSLCAELVQAGCEVRGDEHARNLVPGLGEAGDDDWPTEYLDLRLAVRVVASLDDATAHIRCFSSGHTEAIVTEDPARARRFIAACPSAVVMVNASTRFTDGAEFGYGAEIGNSTQRLHARGPMGLRELTTYRIEVWGDGQVRG